MIQSSNQHALLPRPSSASLQGATDPAFTPPTPPPSEPEPDGLRDIFEGAARWVAGKVVGLVFGTSSLASNAAAGGARGIVHGARIEKGEKYWFHGAMTANLAVIGALTGGPVGAALSTVGGHLIYRLASEETRERIDNKAEQWVDKALAKLPGNPDEASTLRRIANGAVGEVVGSVAGVWAGTFAWFNRGEEVGEAFAEDLTNRIFGERDS